VTSEDYSLRLSPFYSSILLYLPSGASATSVVTVVISAPVLFSVNLVIIAARPVTIGVNYPWVRWPHYHYSGWWRWHTVVTVAVVVPVTRVIAVVISGTRRSVCTGRNTHCCNNRNDN
jgi:hypothetical protein